MNEGRTDNGEGSQLSPIRPCVLVRCSTDHTMRQLYRRQLRERDRDLLRGYA